MTFSGPNYDAVNEYLPIVLGSIDERFLDYLDEDGEMLPATVRRLHNYTVALLDGSINPAAVVEDWPDYYDLLPAFVAAYAPEWVGNLEGAAEFLDGPEDGDHGRLTNDDVAYLLAVEPVIDRYAEMGTTEE